MHFLRPLWAYFVLFFSVVRGAEHARVIPVAGFFPALCLNVLALIHSGFDISVLYSLHPTQWSVIMSYLSHTRAFMYQKKYGFFVGLLLWYPLKYIAVLWYVCKYCLTLRRCVFSFQGVYDL